ncbi:MAG: hypothetical protein A2Y62_01370 [Candidatus Fischerbacteria bacterium RBG_13_37_8]|uniref:Uncharacterized protein n=1 Tax=Candidatus Fischerbacteria bacterium RBG_13_37_8 TaxID=1817863 RepID=A0A1F5VTU2_9BACT|nr:MAG: hypothetical protein A2Y62_01370 [Candidatus Fischerbacteria bacterium RBG_13_37_8]
MKHSKSAVAEKDYPAKKTPDPKKKQRNKSVELTPRFIFKKDEKIPILHYQKSGYEKVLKFLLKK